MRISPKTVWKAFQKDPLLPLLLPECRTIENSITELKWIKENFNNNYTKKDRLNLIKKSCLKRQKHYPLQYILGDQPFGKLDILCRPGVLIPRWETEEWCHKLIELMNENVMQKSNETMGGIETKLRYIDLCTGTGCILLLLAASLNLKDPMGIDLSSKAISLANQNLQHNLSYYKNSLSQPKFLQKDVFEMDPTKENLPHFDLITSNPPYIHDHLHSKSVKIYEPKLALYGNLEFYKNLVGKWCNQTDSFVYELGSIHQAQYVRDCLSNEEWDVGVYKDSANQIRCVYGYRKKNISVANIHWKKVFEKFGTLFAAKKKNQTKHLTNGKH